MVTIADPDFEKLLAFLSTQEQFVFLDTNRQDDENTESLLFLSPVSRMRCAVGDDLDAYLEKLQHLLDEGYYLAGWIGYEFGSILGANIGQDRPSYLNDSAVLADLGVFLKPYRFRHDNGENNFPNTDNYVLPDEGYKVSGIQPNMSEGEFVEALNRVREYIGAGDTYQVNYTMKLHFNFEGSVERWYQTLRRNQSVPYGAYIRNGEERILSLSPELFFRKNDNVVISRPMKGTFERGYTTGEEQVNIDFLYNDIKNRSENVMIVDLLRNDLARLMFNLDESEVRVTSLFDIESYESLLQMTSTIRASCSAEDTDNLHVTKLFKALFPCGSITGAPKIRTMEIIDELEKDGRGIYTGAIGYISPEGGAVFNVPIRTVHLKGNRGEMGVGAGITYDSDPVEEWHESLLKGRFLTHSEPEFYLFETILWQPGNGYWLLESHLARLKDSADFFKFNYDAEKIAEVLAEAEKDFDDDHKRVRLVLYKDGRRSVTTVSCSAPASTVLPLQPGQTASFGPGELPLFDLAGNDRKPPAKPWCFHKTSRRSAYDAAFAEAQQGGLFDYIFSNEDGELTEGSITNLVVFSDGVYKTPPLKSGLLGGVLRKHLLKTQGDIIREEILTREDLFSAEAVFLCNSVRGLVQVAPVNG